MAAAPTAWWTPTASPNTTAPAAAPTSGSRFTKAPAVSAATRAWPQANRVLAASVPSRARPAVAARAAPGPPGQAPATGGGWPSVTTATGRAARAAARNCTADTATGSRPSRRRAWATTNAAEIPSEARTSPSPDRAAPPAPPAATRATPADDTPNPVQAAGGPSRRSLAAAMAATSTGVAPTSRAAWLTLVRVIPAFWTRTAPP
jgi:hypothetical protein